MNQNRQKRGWGIECQPDHAQTNQKRDPSPKDQLRLKRRKQIHGKLSRVDDHEYANRDCQEPDGETQRAKAHRRSV